MSKQALTLALALLTAFTKAEIRKVDLEAGKLTLRNARTQPLERPLMAMLFAGCAEALLKGLMVGAKLKTRLIHEGGGHLVIAMTR